MSENINPEDLKYMRYFMYSTEQMKLKQSIEKKLGRDLVLGTVFVKGEQKPYTEIVTSPKNIKYSDAVIVVYGDIRQLKYTVPK